MFEQLTLEDREAWVDYDPQNIDELNVFMKGLSTKKAVMITTQVKQAFMAGRKSVKPAPIEIDWSEPRKPNGNCSYDHVVADTLAGRIYIEWKGWKSYETATCNLHLNGAGIFIVGQKDITDGNFEFVQEGLDDAKYQVEQALATIFPSVESRRRREDLLVLLRYLDLDGVYDKNFANQVIDRLRASFTSDELAYGELSK